MQFKSFFTNRILSCKELKIFGFFAICFFIILDFFVFKTAIGLSIVDLFFVIIIVFFIAHSYCKKEMKDDSRK